MYQDETPQVNDKVSLTVITAQKPAILSKRFTLAGDGTLQKHPGGQLSQGTAERRTVSIAEFGALLAGLKPNQALTFGVCGHDQAHVVAQKNLSKATGTLPVVARDRAHFTWPTGPGLLMLDYDPPKDGKPLSEEELFKALDSVWPELADSPHIWRESASSCICRTDTGAELRGVCGQRVYVPVLDASDIPRAGAVLYSRLWLAGHGRFDISASGAFLDRSLIDASVWQPERLDFAGGAQCGTGLEQRRADPLLYNADADFVDTRTLADLSPEDQAQLETLKSAARESMRPASAAKQAEWIEERLKAVPNGKKKEMREVFERAVKQKRLFGDFELVSEKHGKVTVAQVLDNPDKFHGARFADPLEPDYANDRRIAFVNLKAAGRPYLFSHAHGGQRFTLQRVMQTVTIEGGELPKTTRKALELMRLDASVFDRDGELVRLEGGTAYPVTAPWLVYYLTRVARFEKYDKRAKKMFREDCPERLAKTVLALNGAWNLPQLTGIVTAPTMTGEGRIIETDGHDTGTGLFLDFADASRWPRIPEAPTDDDVLEAVRTLWHPFREFPFETQADRSGYFAALLTAAVRQILPKAPGFLIDSPTAGSGKTFLAKCLAVMADSDAGVIPPNSDEADMRKMLLALVRTCPRVATIDNVSGTFKSDALCSFLTETHFTDRVLGLSEMVSGRTNCLFIVTGNNVTVVGDLNRRLVRCRINPQCEKPWLRTFDLDPVEHVRQNRLDFVRGALTVLKASIVSDFRHDKGRLASYELWSDFVRNAVIWVGQQGWLDVSDPVASIETAFELDPDTQKLTALLCAWKSAFEHRGVTVARAIEAAVSEQEGKRSIRDQQLYEAMEVIAGERGRINSRLLSHWINAHKGRVIDGLSFHRGEKSQNAFRWCVVGRELCELCDPFLANAEKSQFDTSVERPEKTLKTHETNNCDLCANFTPNSLDPRNGPGTCEVSPDGRYSKTPDDGADCERFERITH